uniref:LP09593p n=1 Tax=Drosophila melanogaster TaxID=7227 RepID=Q9VX58_DROME|nr:uncharacterized protein Dmel_CG8664, isoform B [Drosophila melanogaster]NP_573211.1 uncharacterized protein Dmel_CG8664, isoform A [Drosophila melanogaster]AAF48720.1 uncharacterized protein Dmel_CG8664, isoform A [Drosophila melanogaster]AAM50937.1 LP09593p [Drosophila melanogaster]AHN59840.1 uncharacterized protein Dmel_CG8664, isoform B [Drosophila melanogaster]|eukprot:NP_001285370.1 uncharacterized protein Dmel_CG8664, isoform B [Drosophila melanogaster]
MKVLNVCLLVVASASFLLATANASAVGAFEDFEPYTDAELKDLYAAELMAMEDEFMGVEQFGFIGSCRKILWAGYKGINGTKCIVEEVANVLLTCTNYVDDLSTCTGDIPKDIQAMLNNVKQMIITSNKIINMKSELCASTSRSVVSSTKSFMRCTLKAFYATMSLVRRMNTLIKQGAALPFNTSSCYVDATKKVVDGCNAFVPNINTCIASMT